jgi:hypothetical protein
MAFIGASTVKRERNVIYNGEPRVLSKALGFSASDEDGDQSIFMLQKQAFPVIIEL